MSLQDVNNKGKQAEKTKHEMECREYHDALLQISDVSQKDNLLELNDMLELNDTIPPTSINLHKTKELIANANKILDDIEKIENLDQGLLDTVTNYLSKK